MIRRTFALVAVVALAVWAMPALAEDPKPGTHEGKVVKVQAGKLTMTDKDGKNEHSHIVPATAKITLDGKAAKLTDLKPGQPVKVKIEKKEDKLVVVSIDAKKAD
ncbi:MAG: hypothetical protein L0241_00565 [Planctomycetia bacterium]|nr:hypothetical protein [Planctomycetia bacterium]